MNQVPGTRAPQVDKGIKTRPVQKVAPEVAYLRNVMVNVFFVGRPGQPWVLVDAGLPGSAGRILAAAERRFGKGARPAAIVLTHGHFDHVGALRELATRWDVPVYAHALELPYLTGRSSYPPPDPGVGGGAMALLSPLYPRGPIDLGERVRTLSDDGSVPGLSGWRWLHTPGHTAGHVSLFRDEDRTLIAGDAFVTVKQESALAVLTQKQELHGPPAYYTPDWAAARRSVETLAALRPEVAATGHGVPMRGERMRGALERLARNFEQLAVPPQGRYVGHPARMDASGVVAVPPPISSPLPGMIVGATLLGGAALVLWLRGRKNRRRNRNRLRRRF